MVKLFLLLILLLFGISVFTQQIKNQVFDTSLLNRDSLLLEEKAAGQEDLPVFSMDENEFSESGSQNISSVLTAARDPFFTAVSFNFSIARFKMRGYNGDLSATYLNGMPMNGLDNGFTPWALWGGLNVIMRNREVSQGLNPSSFGFGSIGTAIHLDARAGKQKKQTNFSYALSNRSYVHRWMITHSTGMNKKGWAFSFSASTRWANEGYVPGTFYHGLSYFSGIDKKLGTQHLISLVIFGAPVESGRQGAAVMEMMQLSGDHYYNPYWGYQNGKKRNASIAKSHQPVAILSHEWRPDNKISFLTSVGLISGKRSVSALDWYNAPDPRPDYYRYLPGYPADAGQQAQLKEIMSADENYRQINWQHLYDVNRDSREIVDNVDGIAGNQIIGNRSHYIVADRVINMQRLMANSVFNIKLNERVAFTGGLSYQLQNNHYYQQINDLLGGDFYVDLNQFAERDFPMDAFANQNDLNRPNRIVRKGDLYGYNYEMQLRKAAVWTQMVIKLKKVDLFFAEELSFTKFQRNGQVKNGLFPDNSFRKSMLHSFHNYAVKTGVTYKINGRNYLYINAALLTKPPYFNDVFTSPRTRNSHQDEITNETITSVEGGYILNAPKLRIRLSGFSTQFKDGMQVLSFYDDQYSNFVNYALSSINKNHFGAEFGFEAKILRNISINGAASAGRYYYNGRQNAMVTLDNSADILAKEWVFVNNYRVASTPQEAYNAGISYRSPKYWFVNLNANYFDQMWLSFNPLRRTYPAIEGVEYKSVLWNEIINQVKMDPQFTLDFFGGYSWKLPASYGFKKPVFILMYVGVNNLLNNKNLISGGYEQLRFDFTERNINKFPAKIYYAYGLNYFMSMGIRF